MHGSDPSRSRSSRAKLGVTSPDAPFGGRRLANREIFIIINMATNRWGPIKVSLSIFQPFAGRDRALTINGLRSIDKVRAKRGAKNMETRKVRDWTAKVRPNHD